MSVFELKMPKLGESVTEGTIGKWLKQPGEKVEKYDLLVEVQTDKVNTEIPAEVSGTLKEIKVKEGETVPVGALLAVFETAGAEAAAASQAASGAGEGTLSPEVQPQQPAPQPLSVIDMFVTSRPRTCTRSPTRRSASASGGGARGVRRGSTHA